MRYRSLMLRHGLPVPGLLLGLPAAPFAALFTSLFTVLLAALLVAGCRTGPEKPEPQPPKPQPPPFPEYSGEPPRLPFRRGALEEFERIAPLRAESETGRAFVMKNTRQAIWGSSVAEIRFAPETPGPHRVRILPETTWRMPSLFDTVTLWVRNDQAEGAGDPGRILPRVRDGEGFAHEWNLPLRPVAGWQMLHLRIREPLPLPVEVERIDWIPSKDTEGPRRILLENFTLYQEVLSRIPQKISYVRPHGYAPAFAPVRPNSVTLDFPDGPAAFRPRSAGTRHVIHLKQGEKPDTFVFTYESGEETVTYRVAPGQGGPAVALRGEGDSWVPIWSGPTLFGPDASPEPRFSRMRDGSLFLQYTEGISYTVSLHGKTIQVELESLRESVTMLDPGRIEVGAPFPVPLLRVGLEDPLPLQAFSFGETTRFVSLFPDWWASMASRFEPANAPGAVSRMVYAPKWRGGRNVFRERLYLTVSPRLSEVLPRPSSPRALYPERLDGWTYPPSEHDRMPRMRLLRLAPVDPAWEDVMLARTPEGEWRRYPDGDGWMMKTALAEGLVPDRLSGRSRENGEVPPLYIPEALSVGPWRFTDYDNRVIGAGSYTQTFAEMGTLLQQIEAERGGPVVGRGGAEVLWAGLVSGMVPDFPEGIEALLPLVPHAAWNQLVPYSRLLGMGPLEDFRFPDEIDVNPRDALNRSLALQVAYGAPGRVPREGGAPWAYERARRLVERLQTLLPGRRAERVAYWGENRFLDAGEALAAGALADSRLYVRLEDQTEFWVNGSRRKEWSVRVAGREWTLPPFGFVVRGADTRVVHLPEHEDRTGLTWVETPESLWLCSPDQRRTLGGMETKGCVRVARLREGVCRIDILGWEGVARIDAERFPLERIGTVRGLDREGTLITEVQCVREGEVWTLRGPPDLHTVTLYETVHGGDRNFSP